jgi:hypothetical protein
MTDYFQPRKIGEGQPSMEISLMCAERSIDLLTGLALLDTVYTEGEDARFALIGDEVRGAVDAYMALPDKTFMQRLLQKRSANSVPQTRVAFHLENEAIDAIHDMPQPTPPLPLAEHIRWAIDYYIATRLNDEHVAEQVEALIVATQTQVSE